MDWFLEVGKFNMPGSFARRAFLAVCGLWIPAAAVAASQGTLGSTSTGSVDISATVPGRVQISGLSDVAFGTVDPSTAASDAQDVCVWSNTSGRGYSLTATGSGVANAFTLSDGTNNLAYAVEWADSSGQSAGSVLTPATALGGLASTAVNPTCSAGPAASASLIVKLTTADMQAAVAGSYTGTLTLVVAPQ